MKCSMKVGSKEQLGVSVGKWKESSKCCTKPSFCIDYSAECCACILPWPITRKARPEHTLNRSCNLHLGEFIFLLNLFSRCFLLALDYRQFPYNLFLSVACVLSRFSHVQLFAAIQTIARQAPLSMGFSRQEYWSGLPCPPAPLISTFISSRILYH